jgi:hypothetical protein
MGLSFTIVAGPRQRCHSQVRVPRDSWPHFTVSDWRLTHSGGPGPRIYIPRNRAAQLYPQALGSFFVTSYDSQGYGGGIRPRLHTGSLPSACASVCISLLSLLGKGSVQSILPYFARQRLGIHVPAAKNTRNNRITVWCVWLWVCLRIPLSLLGKDVPATTKKCLRRRCPCGPYRIKGKYAISSSQNFPLQFDSPF